MKRQYETTVVIDAHLREEDIETVIGKVTKLIEKHKGTVKEINRWGKRRLAYEIKKKQYGYYVYIRFEAEGALIQELERGFQLDESILRYLSVLVPKAALIDEEKEKAKLKESSEASDLPEKENSEKSEEQDESSSVSQSGDSGDSELADQEDTESDDDKVIDEDAG